MSWTREQYDSMQEKAHSMGYHLLTPYRKGLKNIRVGVLTELTDLASPDSDTNTNSSNPPKPAQARNKQ